MTQVHEHPVVVRGLAKRFGDQEVLRGVDFQVRCGEVLVVMGPSGSGKTTLIRCLNGLEDFDAGQVRVCGIEIGSDACRGRERSRRVRDVCCRTGMVFQHFNLFPHMTVLDNVIEGLVTVRRQPRLQARKVGERLLDRVNLADKRDQYPSRLSGGQRQRVAIARALAMSPELVFFDEPTSALDPELREEVLRAMRELAADGMTMVVVTHEQRFARDVADRVLFMDRGVILEDAKPETFFTNPRDPRVRTFLRLVS